MNMIILAFMVVGCAIVVFFSQEFGKLFKKIWAIPGMRLLLPLTLVSAFIVYYSNWVLWVLLRLKMLLHGLAMILAGWMPLHQTSALMLANILILMGLSVLPVVIIDLWTKKKTYHPFRYAYLTSGIIWLLVAILLTVSYRY